MGRPWVGSELLADEVAWAWGMPDWRAAREASRSLQRLLNSVMTAFCVPIARASEQSHRTTCRDVGGEDRGRLTTHDVSPELGLS